MVELMNMENKKETVCAVVVTYNRKNLLLECLEAIKKQTRPVDAIYIIDNASTDGTSEVLKENRYIPQLPPSALSGSYEIEGEINNLVEASSIKIFYVRMHKNTGGAGGFYEGVKRGYEKGYDWLWLMDDDAEPKEEALEILSLYFKNKNKNIVSLAGSVVLPDGNVAIYHRGKMNLKKIFPVIQIPLKLIEYNRQSIEIDMASFVGLLVKKEAIGKIGFPKKEFFIHGDDVEYCIRLCGVGKILLIPSSVIVHKESAKGGVVKSFLGIRRKKMEFNKLWLSYYIIRNLVWLGNKYSGHKILFYFQMVKSLIRSILGIILFDDNKYRRIKFVLNAYIDGLKGRFDNKKPKRILYEKYLSMLYLKNAFFCCINSKITKKIYQKSRKK